MIIKLAADDLPEGGDVAVLSASATATNQNIWIEEMNKVMGNYPGINVVDDRLRRRPRRQVLPRDAGR